MTASALIWAVKESFTAYVRSFGAIELTRPAEETADGFRFPLATVEGDVLKFVGAAIFRAHAGLLDVVVADPWLHTSGTGWFISVADVSQPTGPRTRIASLPGPPAAVLGAHDAVLTRDGTPLFDHQYRTGETLAPVRVE
ncbi:HtaA domain-containing protein [Streptomyces sp. NPDC048420]|uniref:HtaA domain-containing protein n=1 Tax=Streptomyces sp. NPDC048420 TaxID=3155755 RepID=UPI00341C35E8